MNYSHVEWAYDFVSGAPYGQNTALLSRSTGEVFFRSELLDEDHLPPDWEDDDDYVTVPHKNDLDLGNQLVMDFVQERCPAEIQNVRAIFSRKGAYARFKGWLLSVNLLDVWHAFENERTTAALIEWCREEGIELEDRQE